MNYRHLLSFAILFSLNAEAKIFQKIKENFQERREERKENREERKENREDRREERKAEGGFIQHSLNNLRDNRNDRKDFRNDRADARHDKREADSECEGGFLSKERRHCKRDNRREFREDVRNSKAEHQIGRARFAPHLKNCIAEAGEDEGKINECYKNSNKRGRRVLFGGATGAGINAIEGRRERNLRNRHQDNAEPVQDQVQAEPVQDQNFQQPEHNNGGSRGFMKRWKK